MRLPFWLQVVGVWVLAAALVALPLWLLHERETDAYLERERVELQAALRSTDALLRTMTNQAFADLLERGQLREILSRPYDGPLGGVADFHRDPVLAVGHQTHRSLRNCCGASLHVVGANGESIVHFDARLEQDRVDSVAARPGIERILGNRMGAQGFELDAVGLAYRRVLPIWDGDRPVGAVEAVLQPGDLTTLLRRIGGDALLYHLLLRADALPEVAGGGGSGQWVQSTDLHPDLLEPVQAGRFASRMPHWLEQSSALRSALRESLPRNEPVTALVRDAYGRHVAVVMAPVSDISGNPIGYAASESNAAPIIAWRQQLAFSGGLVFLLVGALGHVALLMVRSRRGASALREQINAITESMGEGVYVLDAHGRVRYVNQAASDLLGYHENEIVGARANALFHDSRGDQGRPADIPGWDVTSTGGTYRSDNHQLQCRDGSSLPISLTVAPLKGREAGVVGVFHDIADRARELSSLKEQVARDPLTGLGNRRMLDTSLQRESIRARRSGEALSLLMLDVDQFKVFNDTFGHPAGDETLRRIATVLEQSVIRSDDLICRYGGEEFAVILPHAGAEAAVIVAERIRMSVEAAGIPQPPEANSPVVTVSVGCATAVGDAVEPALLIARADAGVYRAKRLGRNRVEGGTERGVSL